MKRGIREEDRRVGDPRPAGFGPRGHGQSAHQGHPTHGSQRRRPLVTPCGRGLQYCLS